MKDESRVIRLPCKEAGSHARPGLGGLASLWGLYFYFFVPVVRPAGFLAGFLAVAVFFLGDRLAVDLAGDFAVVFAVVFLAVDLVAVFFFGDRLAVALAVVFVFPAAGFFAVAVFFFGDRLAVVLALAVPAGFFAVDFDAVFFLVAIYVAPL